MPEQSIELHAIMARLERVEKENRRLKLAGIMFLLVTCAVVVTGQSQTNRTLEAERFVLKDQSGKIRAELSTENGLQSSLKFYDETGKKRKEAAQKRARKHTERQDDSGHDNSSRRLTSELTLNNQKRWPAFREITVRFIILHTGA
jgi:hypothetical protein